MEIREATEFDLDGLLDVERQAFGDDEGPIIVDLVKNLLIDQTAKPLLSLIALEDRQIKGHILFTKARIALHEQISTALLAPLAVVPVLQSRGVGGRLVTEGLRLLTEREVKLVFVLGHPGYYPHHGFKTAGAIGFEAPYPIPDEVADAWMVQELSTGLIGKLRGKVLCADALDRPEYWRE